MPAIGTSWGTLLERIDQIRSTGQVRSNAISDLSLGEPTVFYASQILSDLSEWIADAHRVCVAERAHSIALDMSEAVARWTRDGGSLTLHEAGNALTMADFCRVIEMDVLVTDELGRRVPHEVDEYADPIDSRYRLQRVIEELRGIARFAASSQPGTSLSVLDSSDLCTREELAQALGTKPETVTKWISQYRRRNRGKDPIWVRRKPGQQRGFLVKVPTFMAEFRAGRTS
ncbi:MAG: hypothetical protein Phyf2KO_16930 [Phycisphaerales bacterium]